MVTYTGRRQGLRKGHPTSGLQGSVTGPPYRLAVPARLSRLRPMHPRPLIGASQTVRVFMPGRGLFTTCCGAGGSLYPFGTPATGPPYRHAFFARNPPQCLVVAKKWKSDSLQSLIFGPAILYRPSEVCQKPVGVPQREGSAP
eukprot:gene15149-biopygen5172